MQILISEVTGLDSNSDSVHFVSAGKFLTFVSLSFLSVKWGS